MEQIFLKIEDMPLRSISHFVESMRVSHNDARGS